MVGVFGGGGVSGASVGVPVVALAGETVVSAPVGETVVGAPVGTIVDGTLEALLSCQHEERHTEEHRLDTEAIAVE